MWLPKLGPGWGFQAGGGAVSTLFTKSSLFPQITEMQNIKLIKGRKGFQELNGLSDTKISDLIFKNTLWGVWGSRSPIYLCLGVYGVTVGRGKELHSLLSALGGFRFGCHVHPRPPPKPHTTEGRESRWWEVAWPSPGVLLRNAGGKLERRKRGAFQLGGGCSLTHTFADHFLSSTEEETRTRRR